LGRDVVEGEFEEGTGDWVGGGDGEGLRGREEVSKVMGSVRGKEAHLVVPCDRFLEMTSLMLDDAEGGVGGGRTGIEFDNATEGGVRVVVLAAVVGQLAGKGRKEGKGRGRTGVSGKRVRD
jgi:hypothetical protein